MSDQLDQFGSLFLSNPEQRARAASERIEQNRGSVGDGFAVLIAGYPGAGKTTAAEEIVDVLEEKVRFPEPVLHAELDADAETISVEKPREDARTFSSYIAEKYRLTKMPCAVLDGIESLDEIEAFASYFNWLGIIYVSSHSLARHNRLIEEEQATDDPDMEAVSGEVLRGQDDEAMQAGLEDIETVRYCDYELVNEDLEESEFRSYARYIARSLYQDYREYQP